MKAKINIFDGIVNGCSLKNADITTDLKSIEIVKIADEVGQKIAVIFRDFPIIPKSAKELMRINCLGDLLVRDGKIDMKQRMAYFHFNRKFRKAYPFLYTENAFEEMDKNEKKNEALFEGVSIKQLSKYLVNFKSFKRDHATKTLGMPIEAHKRFQEQFLKCGILRVGENRSIILNNGINEKDLMKAFEKSGNLSELNCSLAIDSIDADSGIFIGVSKEGERVKIDSSLDPHVLIAGATGNGKSSLINGALLSLELSKENPQFRIIDIGRINFMPFRFSKKLKSTIAKNINEAVEQLKSEVDEMNFIYEQMEQNELYSYKALGIRPTYIIIDELAELMMTAGKYRTQIEDLICRIAQNGRKAGKHLIIATQKPNSQVITPLIKGNIITRISFGVASAIDSRIILDMKGAEELKKPGQGIIKSKQGIVEFQSQFIDKDKIKEFYSMHPNFLA